MYQLKVSKMSCGHCVASVTKAVQGVDATAKVEIDLAQGTVNVASAATLDSVAAAITEAGYTVTAQAVV